MAVAARGFYHLRDGLPAGVGCSGSACFAAGGATTGEPEEPRIYCLGRCFEGPVTSGRGGSGVPRVDSVASESIVLAGLLGSRHGRPSLDSYRATGGYLALQDALDCQPGDIIAQIKASRLRGRGGAGFPTGSKWEAVAASSASGRYVIANADEGDPGAYIDRFLLERDPHLLIEAMVIAGIAVGANEGIIYLRAEYPDVRKVIVRALEEATGAGILGSSVLGTQHSFTIDVVLGEGSYLCGEETALIRSIEGRRPEPWARPPYPTQSGLNGLPTLVNNVETLASVPWIMRHGGRAFAEIGTQESTGTKSVSLNSRFARPGLYEVDFGTPLSTIVDDLGGGLAEGELLGVMCGGPLAGVVPPKLLSTEFSFEGMREIGCSVGHGGIIAFGTETSIEALISHVASFVAFESCGKCTPCRTGSEIVARAYSGQRPNRLRGSKLTAEEFSGITDTLRLTSLCGHGSGFGEFLKAMQLHYPDEVAACLG